MGQKLSTIRKEITMHPVIKKEQLIDVPILLTGARGPYESEYEGKPQEMMVISIMIESTAEEFDVFFSYQRQGERADILAAFEENSSLVIGPVLLSHNKLENSNKTMWQFADIESES